MKRQTVIIVIPDTLWSTPEVWGNLKKVCKAKGWSYNTMTRKELPVKWKGHTIWRVIFH